MHTTKQWEPPQRGSAADTQDLNQVHAIVTRAQQLLELNNARTQIVADLVTDAAIFAFINMGRLAQFDDDNFAHDILGMARHWNRTDKRFDSFFSPRCGALSNKVSA